ncbi:MAG: YIP1 family protein [Pseudomonadota bacterium]|nr:YIP1 family protein [Pseudomonadota bacterium]
MSIVEDPKRGGLVARMQGILLHPRAEWDIIDTEPATTQGLFTGYACILAAIPPVALILSHLLFIHWTIVPIVVIAVVSYVASLIGVFIVGFIIDALAPSFDGQKNQVQAMKLAVYSYTAAWVAGILNIVPLLGILAIIAAFYGLYTLYVGLPKLMKSPPEKTAGYFVVTLIAAIVVNMIIGWIIFLMTASLVVGAALGGAAAFSQAAYHNGNLARLEAASRQMAVAAQAARVGQANGKTVVAIDPEKLKAFLPDTVAGLPRTELSAQSAGAAGVASSNAEAVYAKDGARITLRVTDMGALGALAGMAGAMGVQASNETASGYEKTSTAGGRLTVEKWDRNSKSGEYNVIVANRFLVSAEGNAAGIDDLKAAVAAVGPDRLEGLAKA